MTTQGKGKQTLLPLESWLPVPSMKTAKRHRRLLEKVNPPIKPYKMSGWLKKEIREKERKWKEDYEGGKMWVKWYEDRGLSMQTDPVMTFQALGPPPPDEEEPQECDEEDPEEEHGSQILAANGELMTLSDFGEDSSEDETVDGEDKDDCGVGDEEEEELPLSKLKENKNRKEEFVFSREDVLKRMEAFPAPAKRKSTRKRALEELAAKVRAKKEKMY